MNRPVITLACLAVLFTQYAQADVVEFHERDEWEAAAGSFSTIDFTGFPDSTIITDQYLDLGVLFTQGNDNIELSGSFPNDGSGLDGFDDVHEDIAHLVNVEAGGADVGHRIAV